MAFDPFMRMNKRKDDVQNMLGAAWSAIPLIGAAGYALSSRKAGNINPVIGTGSINEFTPMGKQVGEALRPSDLKEKIVNAVLEGEAFKKMTSNANDRKAVIQSLLNILDGDDMGMERQKIADIREQLLHIADMDKDEVADDILRPLRETIDTLNTGNSRMRERFNKEFKELRQFGPQMMSSKTRGTDSASKLKINVSSLGPEAFSGPKEFLDGLRKAGVANISASKATRIYEDKIRELISIAPNRDRISLDVVDAGAGQKSLNFRVMSGAKNGNKMARISLPLAFDLEDTVIKSNRSVRAPYITRMGSSYATSYLAPRGVVEATDVFKAFRDGKLTPGNPSISGMGIRDYGDYALSVFRDKIQFQPDGSMRSRGNGTLKVALSEVAEIVNSNMETVERSVSGRSKGDYHVDRRDHIVRRAGAKHNTLLIAGIEKLKPEEADKMQANLLGANSPFDPGVGSARLRSGFVNGRRFGLLQYREGSLLNRMKYRLNANKSVTRKQAPLVARFEQVEGRKSRFIDMSGKANNGIRVAGEKLGAEVGDSIFYEGMSGHRRVLSIMDMTQGQGAGYYAGDVDKGQYVSPTRRGLGYFEVERTIPVLDADKHGYMSSDLMEELKVRAKEGKGGLYMTREQVAERGYLGSSTNGNRRIKLTPREIGAHVSIEEVTDSAGKMQQHIVVLAKRRADKVKVFGSTAKGNVIGQSAAVVARELSTYNLPGENRNILQDILKGLMRSSDPNNPLNLGNKQSIMSNVIIGSGDLLKKSQQSRMQTGITGVAASLNISQEALLREVQKANITDESELGQFLYRKAAGAVAAGTADADDAGRAMAMFRWGGGFERDGKKVGGWVPEFAKSSELIGNADKDIGILDSLDAQKRSAAARRLARMREVANVGLGIGLDELTIGTGHDDYGTGVGSIEPRTMTNIKSMLQDSSLDKAQQAQVIKDILRRKIGGSAQRRMMGDLSKAAFSMISHVAGADTGDIPRYTLPEIFEKVSSSTDLKKFMREHKDGFTLDFSSNTDTRSSMITQAASETFGGDKQILILGQNALENMKGTEIKQADKVIKVGSYYEEQTAEFFSNLKKVYTQDSSTYSDYAHQMTGYKQEVVGLFTNNLHQLTRGKIKGNTMNVLLFAGAEYEHGVGGLTTAQGTYFKETVRSAKGKALFMDTLAFMNNLKEFMGTSAGKREAGEAMRDFFLNAEQISRDALAGKETSVVGAEMMASRAPMLGKGNLRFAQLHRYADELGDGDEAFKTIFGDKSSQKALRKLGIDTGLATEVVVDRKGKKVKKVQWVNGKKPKSFGDLLNIETTHRDQVRELFESLSKNVGRYYQSEGGGSMYMVKDIADISLPNGTMIKGDIGMAAAAIADADGDQGSLMRFDKATRETVSKMMADPNYQKAVLSESVHTEVYGNYAKAGLKKKGLTIDTDDIAIQKDYKKEQTQASGTGQVDVALNKLRNATIAMEGQDKLVANQTMALLKGLEEHTTIKGKKLPDFRPWAERMSTAVDDAFRTGNVDSLSAFMKDELFPRADVPELYSGFEVDITSGREKGTKIKVAGLDEIFGFIQKAVINAKAQKIDLMATPAIAAANLMREELGVARELADAIMSGNASPQSAMLGGISEPSKIVSRLAEAGDARARMQGFFDNMNIKTAGMVMGGLAAGAMVMTSLRPRTNSEPLMVDGEMPSAALQNPPQEILTASEARASAVNGPNPYDLLGRSQGPGVTHMVEESGFSIRGAIQGMRGISQSGSYINMMSRGNARGSVLINDTRRPITPNYLDRINGEY